MATAAATVSVCDTPPPPIPPNFVILHTDPRLGRERPNNSDGRANDGAPASSGVEVMSSEHYDVRDDDNACKESIAVAAAAEAEVLSNGGATGDDSPLPGAGVRAGGVAGATEGGEGIRAEILVRPPNYGFNDKV